MDGRQSGTVTQRLLSADIGVAAPVGRPHNETISVGGRRGGHALVERVL